MQNFCLTEAPGELAAGIFAGIFASKLIHSWSHALPVSNSEVTAASRAPGTGSRSFLATSPHGSGVPWLTSLSNTISSSQGVSYGKISPRFPGTSGYPLPEGCMHCRTGLGGWARTLRQLPRESSDQWMDGVMEKSFGDVGIIAGGIKAKLEKPMFCKKKGNIFPPDSQQAIAWTLEEESSCQASCLFSEPCQDTPGTGTQTPCPSQLPSAYPRVVSCVSLQHNPQFLPLHIWAAKLTQERQPPALQSSMLPELPSMPIFFFPFQPDSCQVANVCWLNKPWIWIVSNKEGEREAHGHPHHTECPPGSNQWEQGVYQLATRCSSCILLDRRFWGGGTMEVVRRGVG